MYGCLVQENYKMGHSNHSPLVKSGKYYKMRPMLKIVKPIFYWLMWFLIYAAIILVIGTVLGSMVSMLIGKFNSSLSSTQLAKKGAWVGFRYAGVWAGGTSIILCFIKAYKKYPNFLR